MITIEFVIMHIIYVVCISIFVTLWYRKRKDYIELQSDNKALRESRDSYYELANMRLRTIDDLLRKVEKLKERLNAMSIPPCNVTRIETYTPEMKVLKYSVELCRSDFGNMTKEQVIELAKDELYKNLFESIKPYISVFETDDIYRMRTIASGKIVVEDRKKEVEG